MKKKSLYHFNAAKEIGINLSKSCGIFQLGGGVEKWSRIGIKRADKGEGNSFLWKIFTKRGLQSNRESGIKLGKESQLQNIIRARSEKTVMQSPLRKGERLYERGKKRPLALREDHVWKKSRSGGGRNGTDQEETFYEKGGTTGGNFIFLKGNRKRRL